MKRILRCILFSLLLIIIESNLHAQRKSESLKLDNPITVQYLQKHLKRNVPRLILSPAIEADLKKKIKTDPVVKNYYTALKLNAAKMLKLPLIERKMIGKRMLAVSRELLYRMTTLSMVYRIEKDPVILKRINDELIAACNFSDWHPSHPLDVSEFELAVAIAVDWVGSDLPKNTTEFVKTSLIEKGINTSFGKKNDPSWLSLTSNWNQVCTAGMIAAAMVIADKDPELAARVISKCLDGIPNALQELAPDGVYPEGATYWAYGTSFSAISSSILKNAFGSDFGLSGYPPFLKSADFDLQMMAPSGLYYNYADCADGPEINGEGDLAFITLAWFSGLTHNSLYFKKDQFAQAADSIKLSRLAGIGLIWLSEIETKKETDLPLNWKGEGVNPVVVFRGGKNDPHCYFLGGKGGSAGLSHGNMDAGSFIFELDGVRWIIDPGKEVYNDVEQTGFDLWSSCQKCERWSLLTKSNFGHSTLTVNDARFKVGGKASLIDFKEGNQPEATFDMSPVYKGYLESAERRFMKDTDHSLTIEDKLVLNDSTKSFIWTLVTTADVIPIDGGAILKQDGKQLNVKIFSPENIKVSTVMLDPPPLKVDRVIDGLKRVEFRIPAYLFQDRKGIIKVRLSAPE